MVFAGYFLFSKHVFSECQVQFIHFYFQLVQTFQLFEIDFRFVENVKRALTYSFN